MVPYAPPQIEYMGPWNSRSRSGLLTIHPLTTLGILLSVSLTLDSVGLEFLIPREGMC